MLDTADPAFRRVPGIDLVLSIPVRSLQGGQGSQATFVECTHLSIVDAIAESSPRLVALGALLRDRPDLVFEVRIQGHELVASSSELWQDLCRREPGRKAAVLKIVPSLVQRASLFAPLIIQCRDRLRDLVDLGRFPAAHLTELRGERLPHDFRFAEIVLGVQVILRGAEQADCFDGGHSGVALPGERGDSSLVTLQRLILAAKRTYLLAGLLMLFGEFARSCLRRVLAKATCLTRLRQVESAHGFLLDDLGERIRIRHKQVMQGEHVAISLG